MRAAALFEHGLKNAAGVEQDPDCCDSDCDSRKTKYRRNTGFIKKNCGVWDWKRFDIVIA